MTDERPLWEALPDLEDDELEEEDIDAGGETEDLAALKDCLQALADAIASTNLAVINAGQHDMQAATARVGASVAALKRFHDAFKILKSESEPDNDDEAE